MLRGRISRGRIHRNSGAKFVDPRGRIWRGRNAVKFGDGCIRVIIHRTVYRTFTPRAQIFALFESRLGGESRSKKYASWHSVTFDCLFRSASFHLAIRFLRESLYLRNWLFLPPKKGSIWTPIFVGIKKYLTVSGQEARFPFSVGV